MKILANMWRDLPADERQKFIDRADADKSRYY
jgi:HMG (high mobility group) box